MVSIDAGLPSIRSGFDSRPSVTLIAVVRKMEALLYSLPDLLGGSDE